MNKSINIILGIMALLALVLGIMRLGPSRPHGETIPIGLIIPLETIQGESKSNILDAVRLAVDEINTNNSNKPPIKLHLKESSCTSSATKRHAEELIKEFNIIALLGGTCHEDREALKDIATKHNIVSVSLSSSDVLLSAQDPYYFELQASSSLDGAIAASFAKAVNATSVAVVTSTTPWSMGILDIFTQQFADSDHRLVEYSLAENNSQSNLIKDAQERVIDMVYVLVENNKSSDLITAFHERELATPFFGTRKWDDKSFVDTLPSGNNYAFSAPKLAFSQDIQNKAEAKNILLDAQSVAGYDGIYLISQALSEVSEEEGIDLRSMFHYVNYYGASGKIKFDNSGNISSTEYQVFQIVDGDIRIVKPE